MNQILFLKEYKKYKYLYIFQAFIFTLTGIIFIVYNSYKLFSNARTLEIVENNYKLMKLYNTPSNNYISFELPSGTVVNIIGSIIIEKININYPIFSTTTNELLDFSICKFYGPDPNVVGNMCLAGHNYDDNRFFGNLKNLEIGDSIIIINNNRSSK